MSYSGDMTDALQAEEATPVLWEYIAEEVRALAGRRKVRQTELAVLLGIQQSQVSKRLNGRLPFTVSELVTLADFFGTRAGDLLQTAADRAAAETTRSPRPMGGGSMFVLEEGGTPSGTRTPNPLVWSRPALRLLPGAPARADEARLPGGDVARPMRPEPGTDSPRRELAEVLPFHPRRAEGKRTA